MLTFELAFYLAGKDLVKTELQPSDDLVILATNALISAWDATRECLSASTSRASSNLTRFAPLPSDDSTHLFKAIVFLEHAQRSSDQNHYFRLLLIRVYRLLGKWSSLTRTPRSVPSLPLTRRFRSRLQVLLLSPSLVSRLSRSLRSSRIPFLTSFSLEETLLMEMEMVSRLERSAGRRGSTTKQRTLR